uniref:Amino acid transporter transmembrane domain-containing protein n=1 Tax=Oryza punctata TaxID=4537 RepID=A0A0E0M2D5_ORYPU
MWRWSSGRRSEEWRSMITRFGGAGGGSATSMMVAKAGSVGILSIPYTLSEGKWLSLVLLLAVTMVCCYTSMLLWRCMATSLALRGYPDIGTLAFGARAGLAVLAFLYTELYLVAIGFLILEGDNLDKLFPGTSLTVGGLVLFIVVIVVIILPTTWLRSLAVLAYMLASGVLVSVVVVFFVLWAAVVDGVGGAVGTVVGGGEGVVGEVVDSEDDEDEALADLAVT